MRMEEISVKMWIFGGILGLSGLVLVAILCAKKKGKKKLKTRRIDPEFNDINSGATQKLLRSTIVPMHSPASNTIKYQKERAETLGIDALKILRKTFKENASLKKLKIDEKRLQLNEIVGSGNFGIVYKGTLLDKKRSNPREVAVKTVHGKSCTTSDLEMFIKETVIMRGLSHKNVICIEGIVVKDNKPNILIPYMSNGDLKSFVRRTNLHLTLEDLIKFGYQISQGMSYLSEKNFIHRDLAARNCMVSDDRIIKVADFGLARDMHRSDYYKMSNLDTPLPVRWTAVESMKSFKFTTKSDVWSFGVLLWELVTRGASPYEFLKDPDVINYVKSGKRLQCPSYVMKDIMQIMDKCWLASPKKRPSFREVSNMLHTLLDGENA